MGSSGSSCYDAQTASDRHAQKLSSANGNGPVHYLNERENMSISVPHPKLRILVVIIIMFLLWQAIKLLPWFAAVQDVSGNPVLPTSEKSSPVLVSVYYEALCPDSKSFIMRQLLPSFEKASRLMAISFIPYGKAKTIEDRYGNISFSCQHGPVECQANKIHACAINYISDTGVLLKYISCMIADNMNPKYIAEECARQFKVDAQPIIECSNSRRGAEFLQEYGERTSDLSPSMTFVPTVLLNHQHRRQSAILKNLLEEVCAMYESRPPECVTERVDYRYR